MSTLSRIENDDARDLALVKAIRDGDTSAWTTLLKRYQDRLFTVCLRMVRDRELALDLTQDAFVKIIQGLDSYDGRAKLSTWFIRITMNVCLSRLRAERLRRHASLELMSDPNRSDGVSRGFPQNREPVPGSNVEDNERRWLVSEALSRLSPDQRAILVLRDSRGLDYDQIAEVLDVPVGTVKSRLFRARVALRETIEGLHGDRDR
ncbi:MAG: sigma-70 family RNA polymerase sigma factor [Phycisphaeraceae bacterium]|nr:sigma-70 family RNA polymerase sigma factor [Phycisphaeraceae bacterium]